MRFMEPGVTEQPISEEEAEGYFTIVDSPEKADAAIVYANRRRADFGQLNAILLQTEKLYFSADFANSYADTTAAIKRLRGVNE